MPNEALSSFRRLYLAVPAAVRALPTTENDALEVARALTTEMSAEDIGIELAWLESEIRDRRSEVRTDAFAEAHGVYPNSDCGPRNAECLNSSLTIVTKT